MERRPLQRLQNPGLRQGATHPIGVHPDLAPLLAEDPVVHVPRLDQRPHRVLLPTQRNALETAG